MHIFPHIHVFTLWHKWPYDAYFIFLKHIISFSLTLSFLYDLPSISHPQLSMFTTKTPFYIFLLTDIKNNYNYKDFKIDYKLHIFDPFPF